MKLETIYACFSLEFQLKLDEYIYTFSQARLNIW